MARIRAGHHRDSHGPTLPQRFRNRLASMTETTNVSSDIDNAHTVEVFLAALQDQDLTTADAQLDDNLVYENVGFPTIRGRAKAIKMFRKLQKPSFGFEAKIHRIAVNGPVVLTERTDVL